MRNRRSGLFLTELVLDLLIFALCSVVCVSLFVRARSLSERSGLLAEAVAAAQTAAEQVRAGLAPETSGLGPQGRLCLAVRAAPEGASDTCIVVWEKDGSEQQPIYTLYFAGEAPVQ